MTLLTDRLHRVDLAINCHTFARWVAISKCHEAEAEEHSAEIDRLKALRVRVERGHGRMTVFVPERVGEDDAR